MFLVFAGQTYYPNGGMEDLVGSADTLENARGLLINPEGQLSLSFNWWHIAEIDPSACPPYLVVEEG